MTVKEIIFKVLEENNVLPCSERTKIWNTKTPEQYTEQDKKALFYHIDIYSSQIRLFFWRVNKAPTKTQVNKMFKAISEKLSFVNVSLSVEQTIIITY